MTGNLKTLVEKVGVPDEHALSDIVLRQMLLALECIASHNIIHRDVKPENILWQYDETGTNYRFCLGDFGLSNDPSLARTAAGTEPFMAPEVFNRQPQTTKVDIWSLFATIVWTRTPEFRQSCSQLRVPDLHSWLVEFSKMELYAKIRKMASMDPRKRPSATKQLAILDGGAAGGGFDEYASISSSYGSNSGEVALGGDLGAQFSRVMTLRDDTPGLTYGSGSSEVVTSPEMPYYEPYATKLMESVQDYLGAQAGPSKRYVPPSPDPAGEPRVSLQFCPFPHRSFPPESVTLCCC
jgi:serine/threonine protein kinase